MNGAPARFDRDLPLAELLRGVPRGRLDAALARTVGNAWRLVDADGAIAAEAGPPVADPAAVPLRLDIDVVGQLQVPQARHAHAAVAVAWLEMVLASAQRYRMAADLHLETVHADYEALQRKHAALQESEARYRELAAQLEQRVDAQVKVIERAQRQLFQSEKMASVGSLAAGMAHEINNPVGFIRSNLNTASIYAGKLREALLAYRHGDTMQAEAAWLKHDLDFVFEDFAGLLAESINGADRIARIIANLKAYAAIDYAASGEVDLNQSLRDAAAVCADQLPENIRLDIDLQPLPLIACDVSRINQAMHALLLNARQALGADGGRIRVASSIAGNEIRIAISDTGCGIAEAIRDRIFDPFFTTREVGKGMGLGLTVCNDIVRAYGGRIEVETAVGAGSTFSICLPLDRPSDTKDRHS